MSSFPISAQSIMAQTVASKTRALSSKWSFAAPTAKDTDPRILQYRRSNETLLLADLVKQFYFSTHGIVVPIFENESDACAWAIDEIKSAWVASKYRLPTKEQFVVEMNRRWKKGDLHWSVEDYLSPFDIARFYENRDVNQPIDLEADIMNMLADEIAAEIDHEVLSGLGLKPKHNKPPLMTFYFVNMDDALRFKLMWGGE